MTTETCAQRGSDSKAVIVGAALGGVTAMIAVQAPTKFASGWDEALAAEHKLA